jgi:hypothetical protein
MFYYALTTSLEITHPAINDVAHLPSCLNPHHLTFLLCPFSVLIEISLFMYKSFKRHLAKFSPWPGTQILSGNRRLETEPLYRRLLTEATVHFFVH